MNRMKLTVEDLSYLSVGLPDEVKMYHFSGDFAGEIAAIDRWLTRPVPVPLCLRKRLEIQKIFATQLLDDYPLTRADVVEGIRGRYPAADESALDIFIASGNVDYILKNGEMRFQHQAISNIFKTHTHDLERMYNPDYQNVTWETSMVRQWLNDEFYNEAFIETEQKSIAKQLITTSGSADTYDSVFLLGKRAICRKRGYIEKRVQKCTLREIELGDGWGVDTSCSSPDHCFY